jgi:rhodanese-related sulfurtransferase
MTTPSNPSFAVDSLLAAAQQRAVARALPYFGALTPGEAHALLTQMPSARLIDVRTRPEWDYVGRVPDGTLVEWNLYPDGARNPAFLTQLQRAVPERDAPLLFLCRSGVRSDHAARAAHGAGYTRAMNILEGFEGDKDAAGQRGSLGGWRKARLPWIQG